MALGKKAPAKGKAPARAKNKTPTKGKGGAKKAFRGRLPVKRSINLILVNDKKINVFKAIPAVLLVLVLAAAFSKFLVLDRLNAMTRSSSEVSRLRTDIMEARKLLKDYDGIEDDYAHLTYADMTSEEMERVDRVKILELVSTILPAGNTAKSWSVTGNMLLVDISGGSLQNLNELAREIEKSPIVDSCVITTATKNDVGVNGHEEASAKSRDLLEMLDSRREAVESTGSSGSAESNPMVSAITNILENLANENVQARFNIYLCQPPESEESPEPEEGSEPEATPEPTATAEPTPEPTAEPVDAQPAETAQAEGEQPSKPVRAPRQTEAAEATDAPEATEAVPVENAAVPATEAVSDAAEAVPTEDAAVPATEAAPEAAATVPEEVEAP